MKKWFSVLLIITLSLVSASCSKLTDLEVKKKKDPKDMLIQKEEKDLGKRVIDISKGISEDRKSYSRFCDLDYDGKNEKIEIEIEQIEEVPGYLKIHVGGKSAEAYVLSGAISKVYSCDIDPKDDARDIAVIVGEESGDVNLRIFSYKNDLKAYKFIKSDGNEDETNSINNVFENYIDIDKKNILTVEEATKSTGMWSLYKKYKLNEDGHLEELSYKIYKISPSFMKGVVEERSGSDKMSEEEKLMWEDGYIKAYTDYAYGGFYIEKGEYFKVIYDNEKNILCVEKEDGEEGYINLEDSFNKYELNPFFFWLAG